MIVAPASMCGIAFAQPEHGVQVGLHHLVELLGRNVGDPAHLGHLVGRVVDQDIDAAQLLDGGVDDLLASLLARISPGQRMALRPSASTRLTVSSASASSASR